MRPRKEKQIGIIGRVDPEETSFDGQTVKTRTLYRRLVLHYGQSGVRTVDTRDYGRRGLCVAWDLVQCIRRCDDIIVLLSSSGRKMLFPILSIAARVADKRIYHNLIGGRLADDVEEDAGGRLARHLNSFEVNWVESRILAARLRELGVTNARYLPNFKDVSVRTSPLPAAQERPRRFCTFSRVIPEKGTRNAIQTIASINADSGMEQIRLDVFGPIGASYEREFLREVKAHAWLRYRGVVPPEQGPEAIKGYDAMLFPTEMHTEGIPGTIIDAMAAGIPVLASQWPFYSEMLEDGVTGLSYDFERPDLLKATILRFLALTVDEVDAMRSGILARAKSYTSDAVMGEIIGELNKASERPPRVMIVIHGLGLGGAETMVLNLARELVLKHIPVRVVSLHTDRTEIGARMREAGIDVVSLNKAIGPDLRTVGRLLSQMRQFAPTVVHTHLPVLHYVLPAAYLAGTRSRIVHTVHNIADKETSSRVLRRLNRRAFSRWVVPVALTEALRASVCGEYGLDSESVPVVENGIDVDWFRGDPPVRALRHGERFRLLCVARMMPAKNHGLLMEVASRLVSAGYDVALTLVGDGPLKGALEQRARELGIGSRVSFAGPQRDTRPFYWEADLFVLLSSYEGQPMSILEAMAAGLPVVATPVGGVPEVVIDDVNGVLTEPDAAAAAEAIVSVLNDDERYARLSLAATRTVGAHSARAMAERYLELYR